MLLLGAVGAALALNHSSSGGSSLQVLPPAPKPRPAAAPAARPHAVGNGDDVTRIVNPDLSHRGPVAAGSPRGTGSLAGDPAEVVRRFAALWANRSSVPNLRARRELVGLSGGAWATQVLEQVGNSLPSIPGVRSEGSLVTFKLQAAGPSSDTAVVLTKERFAGLEQQRGPYRYTVYLAHLEWLNGGYVVTGWEQQT